VARRQAGVLAVLVGGALCDDLVEAGALSAEVFGKGWAWPSPSHFAAVLLSALAHPAHPRQGWPAQLARRLPGAGPFWAVFAVVAGAQALAVLGVVRRLVNPGPRPAPGPHPAPRSWVATGRRRPLTDQRSRFGFASAAQLRQEASITAARRRAPQTRPSLAGRGQRPAPNDVGYPLGYAVPGGMALWPSWEASLRLVAPPGEGKTFRALVPILRQHPGPALATSTKADLYELSAVARGRLGPVFALDPDSLVPGADRARWSPVAGCERSETAERRAAALLAATGDDGDVQNGAFFRDSARDLLKAYLHAAAVADLDIRAVLDWSRRPEDTTPTDILVSSPGAAPGWGDLVELHTTGAAETTSGVLRYVARALACLSHDAVVADCCPGPGRELDIEQLLGANGTLYLMGKGSRLGAIAPLITALADEVFDCAERMAARSPARRLDPPLLGLLDEAPSIAPVPGLPELLADGRGRGIVLVYAMQSFSQAVTRWGAQKAETMGNATSITAVLGGLTSPNDLSDLERICGQRRVRRESTHRGASGKGGRDFSRTTSWESETVLRADEIRTLPAGRALVLWSRLPPVLVRMPLLSERADWPEVKAEELAARLANDQARALTVPLPSPS
jgi:type IV secretion system protein VirD4